MNLTRRGRVVVVGVIAGFGWGMIFGIQGLNAIVLPGGIAVLAGWVLVRRSGKPTVERTPIEAGEPGASRVVELSVDHAEAVSVRVEDELPAHVRAVDNTERRPVVNGNVAYRIIADRRGVGRIGPVEVRTRDPLGLWERSRKIDAGTEVVTYPVMQQLDWPAATPELVAGGAPSEARHVFDRLREYHPGDSLRDIHWRSSAKRAEHEFIVKEFVADTETEAVIIAGDSALRRADDMASAAASLAVWLLDAGIAVGLEVRDANVPVAGSESHRQRLLTALARTEGGRLDPEVMRSAPIRIQVLGDSDSVAVDIGDRSVTFDEVSADTHPRTGRAVADGGMFHG